MLLLVTSNAHKAQQIQAALGRSVQQIDLPLPELQAIDVKIVIEHKARAAYHQVGRPVLVEDTSLAIHAWNGLPGALIRWFLDAVGSKGICTMLAGYEQLTAIAETGIGYCHGDVLLSFCGVTQGQVIRWNLTNKTGNGATRVLRPRGARILSGT